MKIHSEHGLSLSGDFVARPIGAKDWHKLGNVKTLTLQTETEKVERISSGRNDAGSALDAIVIKKPTRIGASFDTFDVEQYRMLLLADPLIRQYATESAEETITVGNAGTYQLQKKNVDPSSFAIKQGAKEIARETYSVQEDGFISFKVAPEGTEPLTVTYKTLGADGVEYYAGTKEKIDCEIKMNGKNAVTGDFVYLHIPHATLAPSGAFNYQNPGEFATAEFEGVCVKEDYAESDYTVEIVKPKKA